MQVNMNTIDKLIKIKEKANPTMLVLFSILVFDIQKVTC